jgi:1,4-dihydroxy-6-naphthoate synthase
MSILHSRLNLPFISEFVKCHAQEMKEDVMRKHIDLYVNENTIQLNKNGIKAIEKMYSLSGIKSTNSLLLQ